MRVVSVVIEQTLAKSLRSRDHLLSSGARWTCVVLSFWWPLDCSFRGGLTFLGFLFQLASFLLFLLLFEDGEDCSSDPNKTQEPHLSSLPHLLFLYGVGNQYVVVTMAIFDSATLEDL